MVTGNEGSKPIVSKMFNFLNNNYELDNFLSGLSINNSLRAKKYQVVIFDVTLGQFGVIVENQNDVIAIFENNNPNLGKLLMACDINFKDKGGIRVDGYKFIRINFRPIGEGTPNRLSLGALVLLANGVSPNQLREPHHILHANINTRKCVLNLTRSEHATQGAEFKKLSQVDEYIKKSILCTDNVGHARFLRNLRLITKKYNVHRGIHVRKLNLLDVDLKETMFVAEMFGLSKL